MKNLNLNYNYVYFNSNCLPHGKIDKDEYNAICLRDVENLENCQIIPCILHYAPRPIRWLCLYWLRHLPLKQFWYPFIFKPMNYDKQKPFCFIIASTTLPMSYFEYLKKKYKNCKLIKIHRDLMKVTYSNPEYSEENMRKIFDLRMSYDQAEAQKYGFPYFHEIESKIEIPIDANYPICDVFFAGKAKNRLTKILKAYDILTKAGLVCNFYITNAPQREQIKKPGITYSNHFMPYKEMLYKSINSRCMLDINQDGAIGYTSRFLEAIMYNKKLIIDNPSVKHSKYYNPQYIQYVENIDEIKPDFVKGNYEIDYKYDGDFSPIHLIKQIDEELAKQ